MRLSLTPFAALLPLAVGGVDIHKFWAQVEFNF